MRASIVRHIIYRKLLYTFLHFSSVVRSSTLFRQKLVNASNLVKAAKIERRKLQKILITDTKHVRNYSSAQGTHISYQDGMKCGHVNLKDNLVRIVTGNVEKTAQDYQPTTLLILIQGQTIYYCPAEKLINTSNLLQAARIHRINLRKLPGECRITNTTYLQSKGSVQGL